MIPFLLRHLELFFWPLALLALFMMPVEGEHMSLCVFNALGFSWCPGCGLGHSLHYAMHGHWLASWQEHYLGLPALIIILYRIFQLLKFNFKSKPNTL